jgi:Zn-dependent peptidase ImmA (M78 family)
VTVVSDALRGLKLSPQRIADKSGLSLDRVRRILAGDAPAISEVRAIASGLRVPMHLLARNTPPTDAAGAGILFRNTKRNDTSYDVTVEKVAAFVEAALEVLPTRDAPPSWLADFRTEERTYEAADALAKHFRRLVYGDPDTDPATDLIAVLGALDGVVVARLDHSRYEGVSLMTGNYCFVFVSPRFVGRMLFTAGHELGHLLAHHRTGHPALFERPADIGGFGRHSREEAFVDAFASCLLLPDVGLGKSLSAFRDHYAVRSDNLTDLELLLLARFYGVSFDVAARRCEDLGLLPSGMGRALSKRLSKEYGSPEKRADALGLPARRAIPFPAVSPALAEALSRGIASGEVSIGWAADRLGLSIGEIMASNTRPLGS